jgi:hypothetical protein
MSKKSEPWNFNGAQKVERENTLNGDWRRKSDGATCSVLGTECRTIDKIIVVVYRMAGGTRDRFELINFWHERFERIEQ